MAEPTAPPAPLDRPPSLPSTADALPYVPVSWLAVAAAGVAGLFVLVLLAAAVSARQEGRPLFLPQIFILPLAGVVLSFAARRVVRNAEGTRTGSLFGIDLVAAAWWTCLVGGLCYAAYLFAVDYSVKSDAEGEVKRWAAAVVANDLTKAFHRTRDPQERRTIGQDDTTALEQRYRIEFVSFRQADIVRITARNPGRCEFVPGGLRDWQPNPLGVECVFTGEFKCPEGVFPVRVGLRGSEGGVAGDVAVGRQWQVVQKPSGFIVPEQVRLTPYGFKVFELQRQGGAVARQFLSDARERFARPYAYLFYARVTDPDPAFNLLSVAGRLGWRLAPGVPTGAGVVLAVPASVPLPVGPEVYQASAKRLFRLPGGADPSARQLDEFAEAWARFGLEPAATRLKESPDVHDLMTVTDDYLEVRVPVEIPLPSSRATTSALGRLVVRCTEPSLIAELKSLRESAVPDRASTTPPPGEPKLYPWTVVRVESDLKGVAVKPPEGQGSPGPGMMGQ